MRHRNNVTKVARDISFPDWHAFLDAVKLDQPNNAPSRTTKYGSVWSGTETFQDALDLAFTGWSEGAERAKTIASPIFDHVSSLIERETIVYDVEGSGLDIGRHLEGEPECWQQWQTEIAEGHGTRIVRLCFNGSVSGGTSSDTIIAKGAVITALVELLEYAGRRVELTIAFGAKHQKLDYTRILLKAADQPLDMPRVAFAIAHPSMLRRLYFSHLEQAPITIYNPAEGVHKALPHDIPNPEAYDLYIGRSLYPEPQWTNPREAETYIIAELERQGVTLQKETESI